MDPGSGGVGKATFSQGEADPDTVRSWVGDRSVSGKADDQVVNSDDAGNDNVSVSSIIIIASIMVFVAVIAIFGYLYHKKKGPFARFSRTSVCPVGKVYSDDKRSLSQRDAENPLTPANARFSKRTAPEGEEGRTPSKNNNNTKQRDPSGSPPDERSFRRRKATDASEPAEHAQRRASYTAGEHSTRGDVNFATDAHTEYRKKKGGKDERDENRKRAWEEKKEEQDDANDAGQEDVKNSKEAPLEEEDDKSVPKSYRNQKRKSQRQKEPKPEPEAEPQGPGPADYCSFNKQHKREDLRRMSAPAVPYVAHMPEISTRESLEYLGPRLAGFDVDDVSKNISAWMSKNRPQNFEARKKAFRNLTLMWHPDKNADNLEAAKEIFQLLQSKKEYFLKQ
eukprot:GEMP01035074.1.p1 GENE.GEMP01035074.1~~GEMP01035074.1.p1  ORF type:complete len:394 (+),score=107.69 GEMP01035074.1:177-1358(+)